MPKNVKSISKTQLLSVKTIVKVLDNKAKKCRKISKIFQNIPLLLAKKHWNIEDQTIFPQALLSTTFRLFWPTIRRYFERFLQLFPQITPYYRPLFQLFVPIISVFLIFFSLVSRGSAKKCQNHFKKMIIIGQNNCKSTR